MISIVIPYLSGLKQLKECISSINNQRLKTEIIVVHDAPGTLDLKGVKVLENKNNRGAAYSRNRGLEEASADRVLFVDHDIIFPKGAIKKLVDALEGNDIVFPKTVYEDETIMHPIGKEKKYPQISTCFIVRKNSVKEKMDEFMDENYHIYLEDADFFLRANLAGLRIKYVPDAIVNHKLKTSYNENRFYLENKNLLYGILKFSGVNKKNTLHPFHLSSVFSNFICALFNFDRFDWSYYDRELSFWRKARLLFGRHKRITEKSRLLLLYYFFKGIIWNLLNIDKIIHKKKRIS